MVMIKTILALTLAVAPAEPSTQMDEAAALYQEGTAMFDASDYKGAIDKFTKALGIVVSVNGAEDTRLTLLYNIASAHERAFAIDKDVEHLRMALQLYERYKEFADETGDLGEQLDVEVRIASLEKKLRAHDEIQRNRENAQRGDVPPPPSGDAGGDVVDWQKPRRVGLGLTVAGGVATIGGVVLAVVGSRLEPNARDEVGKLANMGLPPDHPAWAQGDQFIEQERRKGRALMGTGVTFAIVGAVGVGVGGYYLVKSKRLREGTVAVVPTLGRGLAGVQITGKF
jgi:tetratricopeptide (TPR) repeat protein